MGNLSTGKRRKARAVASCTECYSKKQKCNRQYPCNHCTRRRRPELCSYKRPEPPREARDKPCLALPSPSPTADSVPSSPPGQRDIPPPRRPSHDALKPSMLYPARTRRPPASVNLASCFGYAGGSSSNLLGLMKKFQLLDREELEVDKPAALSQNAVAGIAQLFRLFPKRHILDVLVQHFLSEVNWIHGMIYSTTFLTQYEQWWNAFPLNAAREIDFAIMLLQVCAYSAQFLPSSTYTADTICGVPIRIIREYCHNQASDLARRYDALGGMRSFMSVLYFSYKAQYEMNEGCIRDAWYHLGSAIRVAQDLGMYSESLLSGDSMPETPPLNDLDIEMRRRVFWNLYIWDRHWSIVLDRQPYISDGHCSVSYPKMRLGVEIEDPAVPDLFVERTLQAQLARIWHSVLLSPKNESSVYDPVIIEEQHDRLCREFISNLPAVFRLQDPETRWDKDMPKLIPQRHMLYVSIFALRCQLYRPLLGLTADEHQSLPQYKRKLMSQQRKYLAKAAISVLDNTAHFHTKINNSQTKFFLVSFYTFESAMVLIMCLLSNKLLEADSPLAQGSPDGHSFPAPISLLEPSDSNIGTNDQSTYLAAITKAISKLNKLRGVSQIAKLGARKLNQVMAQLELLETDEGNKAQGAKSGFGHVQLVNESWDYHSIDLVTPEKFSGEILWPQPSLASPRNESFLSQVQFKPHTLTPLDLGLGLTATQSTKMPIACEVDAAALSYGLLDMTGDLESSPILSAEFYELGLVPSTSDLSDTSLRPHQEDHALQKQLHLDVNFTDNWMTQ